MQEAYIYIYMYVYMYVFPSPSPPPSHIFPFCLRYRTNRRCAKTCKAAVCKGQELRAALFYFILFYFLSRVGQGNEALRPAKGKRLFANNLRACCSIFFIFFFFSTGERGAAQRKADVCKEQELLAARVAARK